MSSKAKYVGHPDGANLSIPFRDGDVVDVHVPHGNELPDVVRGRKVPAEFVKSLLEQTDNWTEVKRDQAKTKKDGEANG